MYINLTQNKIILYAFYFWYALYTQTPFLTVKPINPPFYPFSDLFKPTLSKTWVAHYQRVFKIYCTYFAICIFVNGFNKMFKKRNICFLIAHGGIPPPSEALLLYLPPVRRKKSQNQPFLAILLFLPPHKCILPPRCPPQKKNCWCRHWEWPKIYNCVMLHCWVCQWLY